MGLKDLFKRWSSKTDADAMDKAQRRIDGDYEAMKDDALVSRGFAGGEAIDAANDELADD